MNSYFKLLWILNLTLSRVFFSRNAASYSASKQWKTVLLLIRIRLHVYVSGVRTLERSSTGNETQRCRMRSDILSARCMVSNFRNQEKSRSSWSRWSDSLEISETGEGDVLLRCMWREWAGGRTLKRILTTCETSARKASQLLSRRSITFSRTHHGIWWFDISQNESPVRYLLIDTAP